METENKIAASLAAFGQGQIKAGRDAVFFGVVAAALGRVAWVKGWGGVAKGKADDYDAMVKEQIDGSRATVFRVAALIKGASAKVAKELGNTLAKVEQEPDTAQQVATTVAALRALGVGDLQALARWIKGDAAPAAKPDLADQLIKIFCGSEKAPDKMDQLGDDVLRTIAAAIGVELGNRAAALAKAKAKADAAERDDDDAALAA